MGKFNDIARTILGEAEKDLKIENLYREVSQLLTAKGLKAFEQNEILQLVQKAMQLGYREGHKAAEQNPFR